MTNREKVREIIQSTQYVKDGEIYATVDYATDQLISLFLQSLPERKKYTELSLCSDDAMERKITIECDSIKTGYNQCLQEIKKEWI